MAHTIIARLGGGLFDHDGKAGAALITPHAFEKVSKILTVVRCAKPDGSRCHTTVCKPLRREVNTYTGATVVGRMIVGGFELFLRATMPWRV